MNKSNYRSSVLVILLALSLAVSGCSSLPSWMGGKKKEVTKLPGDRIDVLPVSKTLQPDDGLKDTPVTLPPAAANPDWPQHSGFIAPASGNLAGGAFDKITQATVGDGEAFISTLVTQPVVGGGTVFAMDAAGNMSAHDENDIGKIRWKSKGLSEEDSPKLIGGGLAFDDGKLYAVSGRGIVASFDPATGKELWRKALGVPLRSAPKVDSGKLFVISLDNQLYALNAASGDIIWTHRGIDETADIMKSVSPAVAGETVIVPYSSGEVYALSVADGKELWSESLSSRQHTQAGIFSGIGGDPVIDGGVVIAVSSGGVLSVLAMANGQHLWERPIGAINTPWIAGDYMFLLASDHTLICFAKFTGRIKWSTKLADFNKPKEKLEPITWRGPVVVDGKVIVVSSNGKMVLADAADGKITEKSIAENIYTAPVMAGRKMYLVGQDATLYELQ